MLRCADGNKWCKRNQSGGGGGGGGGDGGGGGGGGGDGGDGGCRRLWSWL